MKHNLPNNNIHKNRVSSKRHCWDGNNQVECEVNSDTEYMTKGHIGQGSS